MGFSAVAWGYFLISASICYGNPSCGEQANETCLSDTEVQPPFFGRLYMLPYETTEPFKIKKKSRPLLIKFEILYTEYIDFRSMILD